MNLKNEQSIQAGSACGLKYEWKADTLVISNQLNESVAELSLKDGIYHDTWFGFVSGDQYREIMEGPYLDFFRRSAVKKKLCNTLALMDGMDPETGSWFETSVMPKLIDAGLLYNAIVIPEDIFAKILMETFEANLQSNLARLFPNEVAALEWLKQVG